VEADELPEAASLGAAREVTEVVSDAPWPRTARGRFDAPDGDQLDGAQCVADVGDEDGSDRPVLGDAAVDTRAPRPRARVLQGSFGAVARVVGWADAGSDSQRVQPFRPRPSARGYWRVGWRVAS
jgi:hypothetical protein